MVSKMRVVVVLCCVALCLTAAPLIAQVQQTSFELTDGDWTYRQEGLQTERITHDFGFSYFYNSAGNDSLYQNSLWYRTAGDTREYGFSSLTDFGINSANSVHLTYQEVGGDGTGSPLLRLDLTYTLTGLSATQAVMQTDWQLTSLTTEAIPVEFFSYTDFDVNLDANSNTAELLAFSPTSGLIKAVDSNTGWQLDVAANGSGLSAWEIASWPETKDKLTDDLVSTLSSATSPLGPTDMASAYQFSFSLGGGQSVSGTLSQSVNPASAVPEPSSILSLLVGLTGFAGISRRRVGK